MNYKARGHFGTHNDACLKNMYFCEILTKKSIFAVSCERERSEVKPESG